VEFDNLKGLFNFSSLYIWQDLRGLLTSVQTEKGFGRLNNNSGGVQEEAMKIPRVYLQRIVHERLRVMHRAEQKVFSHQRNPSEENIKTNSLLS
jgi:hypothetical protein